MNLKWKIIISILSLLILVAVAIPWVLFVNNNNLSTRQQVINDFKVTHGNDSQLVTLTEAKDAKIAIWRNSNIVNASLYIDGLWILLASETLTQEDNNEK